MVVSRIDMDTPPTSAITCSGTRKLRRSDRTLAVPRIVSFKVSLADLNIIGIEVVKDLKIFFEAPADLSPDNGRI